MCTFLFSIYIHHKLYQRKNQNIIIVWQTVTSTKSICLCMCVCMFVLVFVSVCFSVSLCRSCFLAYISETLRQILMKLDDTSHRALIILQRLKQDLSEIISKFLLKTTISKQYVADLKENLLIIIYFHSLGFVLTWQFCMAP